MLHRQLSIYDLPERETVLVDTPSKLEQNIGVARRMVTGTYRDAYAQVQGVVSKWIGVERAVESTSLPLMRDMYRSFLHIIFDDH
jgi:organizing structure protein 2